MTVRLVTVSQHVRRLGPTPEFVRTTVRLFEEIRTADMCRELESALMESLQRDGMSRADIERIEETY